MARRDFFVSLFFSLFLLTLVPPAKAAPYFGEVDLYTENNLTFPDVWSYQFGAFVYDDDYAIASVTAREVTTNQVFILSVDATLTGVWQWGSAGITGTPFIDQLELTATNTNGESSSILTHVLDKETPFDFVTNIAVSDTSVSPTFSWDPATGAESYRVRILDSTGNTIFDSNQHSRIHDTFYKIPIGTLTLDEFYTARIIANDYDFEAGFWELENRSSSYYDFQTSSAPVPEPATMLLFGTGLVSLLGTKLRKRK